MDKINKFLNNRKKTFEKCTSITFDLNNLCKTSESVNDFEPPEQSVVTITNKNIITNDIIEESLAYEYFWGKKEYDSFLEEFTKANYYSKKPSYVAVITLSNCNLLYLESSRILFQSLVDLNLSHNKLSTVPYLISTTLKVLNLSNNHIIRITDTLYNLVNLEVLDVSNNRIVAFPDKIHTLIKLKDINMSYNNIRIIHNNVMHLKHVEVLNLEKNPITELPLSLILLGDTLVKLPKLNKVDLDPALVSYIEDQNSNIFIADN